MRTDAAPSRCRNFDARRLNFVPLQFERNIAKRRVPHIENPRRVPLLGPRKHVRSPWKQLPTAAATGPQLHFGAVDATHGVPAVSSRHTLAIGSASIRSACA